MLIFADVVFLLWARIKPLLTFSERVVSFLNSVTLEQLSFLETEVVDFTICLTCFKL